MQKSMKNYQPSGLKKPISINTSGFRKLFCGCTGDFATFSLKNTSCFQENWKNWYRTGKHFHTSSSKANFLTLVPQNLQSKKFKNQGDAIENTVLI
jgi:hypothetical protein